MLSVPGGRMLKARSVLRRLFFFVSLASFALIACGALGQTETPRVIDLPTSKQLSVPSPGRLGSTNSFPVTIALSPDGRYAALLNFGYGTQETSATQSIGVIDLK